MDLRSVFEKVKEKISEGKVVGDDIVYEVTSTRTLHRKDLEEQKTRLMMQVAEIDKKLGMFK